MRSRSAATFNAEGADLYLGMILLSIRPEVEAAPTVGDLELGAVVIGMGLALLASRIWRSARSRIQNWTYTTQWHERYTFIKQEDMATISDEEARVSAVQSKLRADVVERAREKSINRHLSDRRGTLTP